MNNKVFFESYYYDIIENDNTLMFIYKGNMTYKEIDELVNKLEICISKLELRNGCPNCESIAKQSKKEVDHMREVLEKERMTFRKARDILTKDYLQAEKPKLDDTELRDIKLEITRLFVDHGYYTKSLGHLEERAKYGNTERTSMKEQHEQIAKSVRKMEYEMTKCLEKIQ